MRPVQVYSIINRWHVERGFAGFGYHGLIMPDGTYFQGRPFKTVGAHVMGRNAGTLGFLLIESREMTHIGRFEDWFEPRQRSVLRALLGAIDGLEKVSGHNDYAPKLCPGFKVVSDEWL